MAGLKYITLNTFVYSHMLQMIILLTEEDLYIIVRWRHHAMRDVNPGIFNSCITHAHMTFNGHLPVTPSIFFFHFPKTELLLCILTVTCKKTNLHSLTLTQPKTLHLHCSTHHTAQVKLTLHCCLTATLQLIHNSIFKASFTFCLCISIHNSIRIHCSMKSNRYMQTLNFGLFSPPRKCWTII